MNLAKKIMLIVLALVMVLAMISCDKEETTTTSTSDSTTSEQTEDDSSDDSSQEAADEEKDYSETMVITFASVQVTEGTDYNAEDDAMTMYFRDMFNIEWDMISLSWENWAEKLRIWINSGDMPDMATWNYIHSEALTYVDQELIREFPEDWKETWPNAAQAWEDSVLGPGIEDIMGGTYMLPKPIFSLNKPCDPLVAHTTLYMRKDWMEAVGYEVKDSYSALELIELGQLFLENDPGSVGDNLLPISVSTTYAAQLFVQSYNVYYDDFYQAADGTYYWGPADESTLEGLKVYQEAYNSGVLNPDFFSMSMGDEEEQFQTTGVSGILLYQGVASQVARRAATMEANLGVDADEAYHTAFVVGEDGYYRYPETMNYWTCTIFSPVMEDAKFERIMDMIDYAASEEGQYLIRRGFEGIDWEYGDDGEIVSLLGEDETLVTKYPSYVPNYINMVILSDDYSLVDPSTPEEYRERVKELYALKVENSTEETVPRINYELYFYSSDAMDKVSIDFGEEYARLILMEGDLEENWLNWVDEYAYVIDPVLEELNALN